MTVRSFPSTRQTSGFGTGILRAGVMMLMAALPLPLFADGVTGAGSGLIFESRPPGEAGGGIAISVNPNGHTFRLLERTHVDAIGARIAGTAGESVYAAIHAVATPQTVPDAVTESTLLGTTLLTLPGSAASTVTGPIGLTLEPGWYAILIGSGRHGATSTGFPTAVNAGTVGVAQTVGPYSVNATTNARTLQGATTRYVVFGETLPPEPLPSTRFLFETARPPAWGMSQFSTLTSSSFRGTRFSIDSPTRIGRVAAWLGNGSGTLFAAVLPIAGPGSLPPIPGSPQFETNVVATAVIPVLGPLDEYAGDFGDVTLAPGHYALIFGSGRFGADGSAWIGTVTDEIVAPGTLFHDGNQSGSWFDVPQFTYRMVVEGVIPELDIAPDPVDFGSTAVGATVVATVTVGNLRGGELTLGDILIVDDAGSQFALGADADDCVDAVLETDGECSFGITFTPSVLGSSGATLRVLSDGVPSPYEVAMTGTGLAGFTVTPSAGTGGSITPDTAQIVAVGEDVSFTLNPDAGYSIGLVGGDCGGTLDGNLFTTAPIVADCEVVADFVADIPVAIEIAGGGAQSATVLATFGDPLQVRVLNVEGSPLEGIDVVFEATDVPGQPGADVPSPVATTASGIAAATAVANAVAGAHEVHASVSGVAGVLVFDLTNLPGPPATITAIGGGGQSAVVGTLFADPLIAQVHDSEGNPVPGVAVDFEAPSAGAGALLSESFAHTDDDGLAQVTARANGQTGAYFVLASVGGVPDPAEFALANTEQLIALDVAIDNGVAVADYGDLLEYLVTVSNDGSADAKRVAVATLLPDALDVEAATWVCLDPGSGCTAGGSGALIDSGFTVSVGGSVRWLLSVAVRTDASADRVVAEAGASSPDQAAVPVDQDLTRLRLFADGFEAAPVP